MRLPSASHPGARAALVVSFAITLASWGLVAPAAAQTAEAAGVTRYPAELCNGLRSGRDAEDTPAPPPSEAGDQGSAAADITGAFSEPPISWTEWTVGGPLPASERARLQVILEPEMERRRILIREVRCELQDVVKKQLGYHLGAIAIEDLPGTGKRAVLEIEPVTRVRRIEVEVTDQPFYDVVKLDTIFENEIVRRMRLRTGSIVASEPAECHIQLGLEEERVRQYLRSLGYFEAQARIGVGLDCDDQQASSAGPMCPETVPAGGAANLTVCIAKGPRYEIDIDRIRVEGNTAITSDEIRARFRHGQICVLGRCLLERFSLQNLNQDVQKVEALYKKRGYPAVRVRTDFDPNNPASFDRNDRKVEFTVLVNERSRMDVVFEGNDPDRFPAESLESLLTFDEEGSYDDVEVIASADAIRRHYQSRGYFEANVTAERVDLPVADGVIVRIVFTIHPGPRLRVQEVGFAGNAAVSEEALRGLVQTRASDASPLFGASGYLTAEDLAQDVARILARYRERGYHGAEVDVRVSRSAEVMDNAAVLAALVGGNAAPERGLHVRFIIREGTPVVVRRVDFAFQGPHTRTAADLQRLIAIRPGDAYTEERVNEGRERIGRYYFEHAHPRARVSQRVCPRAEAGGVDVVYDITEGQQVRFGKVLLHGNFKTKDWVILSELGFQEGAPFTLGRAEAGPQNLRASGLFNAVHVRFIGLEGGTGQDVHAVVDVQERHDYWLGVETAGGYSSDSDFFAEGAAFNNNILGHGLRLDLRGQYGQQFQSIEGKFVVPHWVIRRLTEAASGGRLGVSSRFEASAFWRRDDTERFGELTSFGASGVISKLGRRGFFEGWLLSMRYDIRQRGLDEDLVRGSGYGDEFGSQVPVSIRTGAVGPQLVIDKRKDRGGRANPLTPEAGFKLELRALYASPLLGGQDEFVKLGVGAQHFWKPAARLLVTNGMRYDHGVPVDDSVLPEVERYFAGGDTTVRGFEEDRLATEIVEQALPPLWQGTRIRVLPAGGNVRFIHNLDVQMSVWELLGVPVASAVFLDTGLVTNSLQGFSPTDLRHALGVALFRWVAPFGSLSIEYAIPLDPGLGDNPRGRFHINFGLLF